MRPANIFQGISFHKHFLKYQFLRNTFRVVATLCSITIVLVVFHQYWSKYELRIILVTKHGIGGSLIDVRRFRVHPTRNVTLPDLNQLGWPPVPVAPTPAGIRNQTDTVTSLPGAFQPVMSRNQRELSAQLLRIFAEVMFANEFGDRFMLYGGSLLGSYRHHDFIPWDDEIDVLVDITVRPKVREELSKLAPQYQLYQGWPRDKLYTRLISSGDEKLDLPLSRPVSSWGWPFLDISYYETNATHVKDVANSYGRYYAWPKGVVFPLYFRPFGTDWYPAPRNTAEFNRLTYGQGPLCQMQGYSHVLETQRKTINTLCLKLSRFYAFVEHKPCNISISRLFSQDDMVLGGEELMIPFSYNSKLIFHTLCLAVPRENVQLDAYGI